MARNSEKAQSMLFRFREQQAADLGIIDAGRTRRPKVITEVSSIPSCEKWRGQVVKDISRKVTKIQDRTYPILSYPILPSFSPPLPHLLTVTSLAVRLPDPRPQ